MQITNATYRALLAAGADKEVRAVVGGVTYSGAKIVSAKTTQSLGKTSLPIGNCVAAQLDLALWNAGAVPRMAEIELYVRLDDGATKSNWLHKGTYYVDTREYDAEDDVLTLHAFDAMLKTEQSYTQPGSQGTWPRTDTAVVTDIAQRIGVAVDARTLDIMNKGYQVQYPGIRLEDGTPQYSADGALSMREVLGYIGVMYGGNWIISDAGALRLVPLTGNGPIEVIEEITEDCTWVVPDNVVGMVKVLAVGGGGLGVPSSTRPGSGPGGGSGYYAEGEFSLSAGQEVQITIGQGSSTYADGGATSFGDLLTAQGGKSGNASTRAGGDGGAGGGGGAPNGQGGSSLTKTGGAGSSSSTSSYGGSGAGAGSPDTATRTGVEINGVTCFVGGAGGHSSYSYNSGAYGGAGYRGYGNGGRGSAMGGTRNPGSDGVVALRYSIPHIPIGTRVSTLNTSPALDPISRVTLVLGTNSDGAEVYVTSGDNTGRELRADCPWGTQAIVDDLIAALGGYVYQPFDATDALLDPAAELGDGVAVGDIVSQIMSIVTTYDALYTADIGAPQDEEIDHEYPYQARQNREITQKLATTSAQLRVDVDSIETEVSGKIDEEDAKTLISQGIGGITLTASAGENQSTVSIKSDGITVDSAVVEFSNIVANSVSASNITAGTINAANQTLNLKGSLKIYTPDGTLVGEIGGHEDAILRAAWLTDRINRATFMAVESASGTTGTAIIGGDEIQLRLGPIRLDSSVHYGTSAPDSSTPGDGTEGALYFKI